jgi:hypothetical protein
MVLSCFSRLPIRRQPLHPSSLRLPPFGARISPFQSIEGSLRYYLNRFSYDVQGFRPYRYILDRAYMPWWRAHERLEKKWDRAVGVLLENYDDDRAQMVARCLDQAGAAYAAMHALGVEQDYDVFLQESVALFQSRVPTPSQLLARLKIEIHGALILNPGEVEQILAEQEDMANGRALQGEIAALERRRLIDTFKEMASPWDEVVHTFRAKLHADVMGILDVIGRREHVPGTTAARILGLRELYDIMSLGRDGQIEACLAHIETAARARSPEEMRTSADGLRYDVGAIETAGRSDGGECGGEEG